MVLPDPPPGLSGAQSGLKPGGMNGFGLLPPGMVCIGLVLSYCGTGPYGVGLVSGVPHDGGGTLGSWGLINVGSFGMFSRPLFMGPFVVFIAVLELSFPLAHVLGVYCRLQADIL